MRMAWPQPALHLHRSGRRGISEKFAADCRRGGRRGDRLCRHAADPRTRRLRKPRRSHRVGLLALFVFAPAGAIAGLVLGTELAMRMRGGRMAAVLPATASKHFGTLIVASAPPPAPLTMSMPSRPPHPGSTQTPPNPILVFEVRLPAGTALPTSARDIAIELQTDINRMPGEQTSTVSAATATDQSLQATSTSPFVPPIGSSSSKSRTSPTGSTASG